MAFLKTTDVARQYSDFNIYFLAHPTTRDLAKVTGVSAVTSAIKTILKTKTFERVMRPQLGTRLHTMLFEPLNPLSANIIQGIIQEAILREEPRANITSIIVVPEEESNRYRVEIKFTVNTQVDEQVIETYLKREI